MAPGKGIPKRKTSEPIIPPTRKIPKPEPEKVPEKSPERRLVPAGV